MQNSTTGEPGDLPLVSQEDLQAFLGMSGDMEDLGVLSGIGCSNVGSSANCNSNVASTSGSNLLMLGAGLDTLKNDPILSAAFLAADQSNSTQVWSFICFFLCY